MLRALTVLVTLSACGSSPSGPRPDAAGAEPDGEPSCDPPAPLGCACAADAASGGIPVSTPLTEVVADPVRCAIYGLAGDELVVVDTSSRSEARRIPLTGEGTDVDVSATGVVVVGHGSQNAITILEGSELEARVVTTAADAYRVEAGTDVVFYATSDQFNELHRIPMEGGPDTTLGQLIGYQVDLELSAAEDLLYVGESGTTGGDLIAYGVAGGGFGIVDETPGDYSTLERHVFVSLSGNAYYAGQRFAADDLDAAPVTLGERILAENASGTIAIGTIHRWDPSSARPGDEWPVPVDAAAFTADGREVWVYLSSISELRYFPSDD